MSNAALRSEVTNTAGGAISALLRAGSDTRPAIVFLHGIGSNASSFQSLLQAMPPGAPLIAWDAPGYGGSAPLHDNWPLPADYAASLHAFLDARAISAPVDLVGHSLGCLMAAAFARAYRDRVRRLVLISPAHGYRVARGGTLPEAVAQRITDIETLGPARMADARAERLVHDAAAKPAIVAAVRAGMASLDPAGYAQAVRMLASGDLIGDLAHVRQPTLVLTGLEDRITPASGARRVRDVLAARAGQRTPPDRYLEIPGAGHAVYLEAEAEVVATLGAFLGAAP